jgi:hypothetical protein
MPLLKTVHVGAIQLGHETMCTIVRSDRQKLIYALNDWMFDYQYANRMEIKQLPPLDDWCHSTEDVTYWSVAFPNPEWSVTVRAEPIEFDK